MSFSEITNNIAVAYTLLLILIFLMYIAFKEKPLSRRNSKKS